LGKRSRGTGTGRPGWEGEEVVGVLREDGMPGEFCGGKNAIRAVLDPYSRDTHLHSHDIQINDADVEASPEPVGS
jgi:hypothetical protein